MQRNEQTNTHKESRNKPKYKTIKKTNKWTYFNIYIPVPDEVLLLNCSFSIVQLNACNMKCKVLQSNTLEQFADCFRRIA